MKITILESNIRSIKEGIYMVQPISILNRVNELNEVIVIFKCTDVDDSSIQVYQTRSYRYDLDKDSAFMKFIRLFTYLTDDMSENMELYIEESNLSNSCVEIKVSCDEGDTYHIEVLNKRVIASPISIVYHGLQISK